MRLHIPNVRARIEFPKSSVYDFVGLLVLSSSRDQFAEDVVATVEVRDLQRPVWDIDLAEAGSAIFAGFDPPAVVAGRMATEPEFAAGTIRTFAEQHLDDIVTRLRLASVRERG